jgi:hypothetical protein
VPEPTTSFDEFNGLPKLSYMVDFLLPFLYTFLKEYPLTTQMLAYPIAFEKLGAFCGKI